MAKGMTDLDAAREWRRFAKMDLDGAEFLMQMTPLPTEIICFHCQQSAEKSLKSILVLNSIFPPKIHDLQGLKELCLPYLKEPEGIPTAAIAAQLHYIQEREWTSLKCSGDFHHTFP
ncbi:MAG: HEPN domain-containing protein [Spirochaetales bacterium]|jgi:HEPN domain-containing protein|nr:HEPN domain-containing protein [Spirochaetales bacterium]